MKVTFCGHKEVAERDAVEQWLRSVCSNLIAHGADEFYLGGYGGFDHLCAAVLRELKKPHPQIRLILILPYLDTFEEAWGKKYPRIAASWRENWANLSTYFKFPQEVRRLIYTTNAIEGFNRQLRKVTKAKAVFPTDDSLLKMLYLAMMDITKKWTGRRQDWSFIHAQLAIYYADRMPE